MSPGTILIRETETSRIYRRRRYSIVEDKDSENCIVIAFPDGEMHIEDFPSLLKAEADITCLMMKYPKYA